MFDYSGKAAWVLPLALGIVIVLTILITLLLKNKSDKIKQIPFITIAVILLVMEAIKQYLAFPSYSLWNVPLHFCSLFMVWFSLAAFSKGKAKEVFYSLAVACGFLFLVVFYFNPKSVIGNSSENVFGSFGSFHTFFYHHFITLFTLLAITLKQYKPKYKHIKWLLVSLSIYFVIADTFAHVLNTNYASLLYNILAPLQAVSDTYGMVAYTVMMYIIGAGGPILLLVLSILISAGFKKLFYKHKPMVNEGATV